MAYDANDAAEKYGRKVSQGQEDFRKKVSKCQKNPGALAAAQADFHQAKVIAGKQKFIDNCNATSPEYWKKQTMEGSGRWASSHTKGQPKQLAFHQAFSPFVESKVAALAPRGNLEQNLARSNQMARSLAEFKYTRRSI